MNVPRPRRAYWFCQVIGWLLYDGVNAAIFATAWPGHEFVATYNVLVSCAVGAFYSDRFRWVIHKRGWLRLSLLALLPRVLAASVVLGALLQVTAILLAKMVFPADVWRRPVLATIVIYLFNFSVVFFGWQLIYFGVHLFERSRRLEVERWQAEAAARESELRYLKAQINPHFLFNCLNSLRALISEDTGRAQSMVTRLASLLRYVLGTSHDQLIPFGRELEVVKDYLALEGMRFDSRLRTRFDVVPESQAIMVPPMLLQMLVENGVKHGIGPLVNGGDIAVSARLITDCLEIEVDNSKDPSAHPAEGQGIGLANARERLSVLYNGRAALEVEPGMDRFIARVRIPLP